MSNNNENLNNIDTTEDAINTENHNKESAKVSNENNDFNENNAANNLQELLDEKESEKKELIDRMQRMAAEFDNFRKRTQKEKGRIYVDAVIEVVGKFLPVVDNLERAISAAEQDDGQGLKEGVNLIYKQILDVLCKLEVTPIEAKGQCFDPEIHNAVMHVEDESIECNLVVEEFQKGYIYKDETVVRHSVVKVAN